MTLSSSLSFQVSYNETWGLFESGRHGVRLSGEASEAGVVLATSVAADGWTLSITFTDFQAGALYDLDPDGSPKIRLNISSPGYDSAGNATTKSRKVVATKLKRLAYPNQVNPDEVQSGADVVASFALSEHIHPSDVVTISTTDGYATDTNGGGENAGVMINAPVTNNSLLAYPKAIARWAYPHVGHYATGDFDLELVAFQAYAENGKPVAAVKFTASDGANTSETVVTNMIVSDLVAGDQNAVLVYRGTIDVTGLNNGPVTVRAEVFPNIGDAAAVRDTADETDGFETYKVRLDKAQAYPRLYAYVSTTGSDGSGVASLTPATAQSSPFASVGAARTAIMAANGGSDSGGIIRLEDGTYNGFGTVSNADTTNEVWLTVEAVNAGLATINPNNAGHDWGAGLTRLRNIIIGDNGSKILMDGSDIAGKVAWLDGCVTALPWSAVIYKYPRAMVTGGAVSGDLIGFGTTPIAWTLVRGVSGFGKVHSYCLLGCYSAAATIENCNPNNPDGNGNTVVAFNRMVDRNGNNLVLGHVDRDGLALVQNVFEAINGSQPNVMLYENEQTHAATNVLIWHNTTPGQRVNFGYNDINVYPVHANWSLRGNVFNSWNTKCDTYSHDTLGFDGGRVNNWSVVNGVGFRDNVSVTGGESPNFIPEFIGLNSYDGDTTPAAIVFTDEAGNDFRLSVRAEAGNRIPVGRECLPFDLAGTVRPNDGTGTAGAFQ